MTTQSTTIIALDISQGRADALVWNEPRLPKPPRDFYESSDFGRHHHQLKATGRSIEFIASLDPAVVIFENTGRYSYFWLEAFEKQGIPFLIVNQTMVEDTRKSYGGTDNKDDAFDCVVILQIYLQAYVQQYDRRFWVKHRHPLIKKIRACLLELKTVTKKRSGIIATAKQRLESEYPAKARVQSKRDTGELDPDELPGFWAWLARRTKTATWELGKGCQTRFDKEYAAAVERKDAGAISWLTRDMAAAICQWHVAEALLERELLPMLSSVLFKWYFQAFRQFGFGQREAAWLLVRIYPFEEFTTSNNHPIIDHTKSSDPSKEGKLTSKNRSLRRFRQALGCGKIQKSSGKRQGGGKTAKNTGSSDARSILWTYVFSRIERGLLREAFLDEDNLTPEGKRSALIKKRDSCPKTVICLGLRDYFISKAYDVHETKSGGYRLEKVKGRRIDDARNATCRKVAEALFWDLLRLLQAGADF